MKVLFPLISALLACQMHAQTPCDVFDHNGDGTLGANTWLYVLGSYGVEGASRTWMDPGRWTSQTCCPSSLRWAHRVQEHGFPCPRVMCSGWG